MQAAPELDLPGTWHLTSRFCACSHAVMEEGNVTAAARRLGQSVAARSSVTGSAPAVATTPRYPNAGPGGYLAGVRHAMNWLSWIAGGTVTFYWK